MADQISIEVDGLAECLAAFNQLEGELRRNANGELRRASAQVAREVVIPMLGGGGAPQESKIVAAAGPKSDRYVVVAVPARKPRLSGLRKTPAASAKLLGWALEKGSGAPQFHHPRPGGLVATHTAAMTAKAVPKYRAVVEAIMAKYGLR